MQEVADKPNAAVKQGSSAPKASLERSSSVSGEEGRASTGNTGGVEEGVGAATSASEEVTNGNQQPSEETVVGATQAVAEAPSPNSVIKPTEPISKQEDEEEDEDEEDDNGWSGDESSEDEGRAASQKKTPGDGGSSNDGGSGNAMPGMSTQTWSLQELEKMWLQYDNNNSGQISFAEIEKVVVEQYPEFDNKEVPFPYRLRKHKECRSHFHFL